MNPRGGNAAGYKGAQNRFGNANPGQARPVKCYNCNGTGHIARNCTQPKRPQNSEYYKDKMLLMQAQENGVALDAEQLLFLAGRQDNAFDDDVDEQPVQDLVLNVDNVFHADDCDTFDSNVDKAPTAQTMCMANLSSVDPDTDEVGPSYDLDILFEVHDHDHYQDAACAHHEEHVMHDSVQLDHVVDSHADYTSDSNMIPYDQYVKDNEIAPHDYSKENFLATFTPQKQLTPEQIFWSNDLIKLKFEALKERTTVSRPIKALTVDNFEGIQKALTKEIKEMKDVFEELEAEVAQYDVDRKHDAIKRKNLLIANDNLIAECLSKEVFSVATNSDLNVARFTKITIAHTDVEARCLELEAELAKLLFVIGKMQASHQGKDNVIRQLKKQISQLQVTRSDTDRTLKVRTTYSEITKLTKQVTNLQAQNDLFRAENDKIKQHYKELYDSIKIIRAKHIEQVTTLTTKNVNLKARILEKVNGVKEAKVIRPLDRSIVSACRYIKHSQELLEYVIGTCPQGSQQQDKQLAHIPLIRKRQVTFAKPSDKSDSNTHQHVVTVKPQKTNVPVPPSTGVNSYPNASRSQPKSNVKPNRISPAKGIYKLPVEDQPRTNKSHFRISNRVDTSSRLKRTVINSNL
nr:hypothetical protein [Tanacetum cinerariifolium]